MRYPVLALLLLVLSPGCSEPAQGNETLTFDVEGMTCQNCVNAITRSIREVEGVVEVHVDLESATATVVASKKTPIEAITAAVPGSYTLTRRR